ncbi:MAG: hypothetical protein J4F36_00420 [Nitrosopumilaceae archaeon]|nr:hypothetical protein [Nitrosopumilaceae archaeon]
MNNFAFADTTINNVVTNEQFFSSLINTIFDLIEFNDEQQISFLTLIVFPFAAFILFRSDFNIIKSKSLSVDAQKFFSLCFILILVSPFGIIPLYASTNLGLAFAQEINNQTLSESMSDVLVNITNSTDTLPTNSTDTLPTNSTDTLPTNSTDFEIIIPEASLSFQFDDLSSLSNNDTSSKSESAPLNLNGQDDFIQIENVTVTNDLNGLTITAWVNPD